MIMRPSRASPWIGLSALTLLSTAVLDQLGGDPGITGHTDRLGSSAYNQRLSERRAMAVRNDLVSTRGLEASRSTATGLGETQPVTRAEDCVGERRNAALVACLQPDRRVDVDVDVTGTR